MHKRQRKCFWKRRKITLNKKESASLNRRIRLTVIKNIVIGIVGSFSSIMWLVDMGIMLLGTLNLVILCNIEKRHKLLKNNHKIT